MKTSPSRDEAPSRAGGRIGTRLISVGNVVIDITAGVTAFPERGGDALAKAAGVHPGGAAFNTLVAAARQGMRCAYGGAHGTGVFGDLARRALRVEGIEVLLAPTPDADTGWDVAITDAGGERTFITAIGAETLLTREHIDAIRPGPSDSVHVSGYGLLQDPGQTAIVDWLATLPATTVVLVDPGPLGGDIPETTMRAVLQHATWWSGTSEEAARTTGSADAATAARMLVDRLPAGRPPTSTALRPHKRKLGVVVRLGRDGCLVAAPGAEPMHVPGFRVDAVDSNGAGDAHVGAFLAALAFGENPVAACRRANACAAISVTRPGPATAPTRAEVDALLHRR